MLLCRQTNYLIYHYPYDTVGRSNSQVHCGLRFKKKYIINHYNMISKNNSQISR